MPRQRHTSKWTQKVTAGSYANLSSHSPKSSVLWAFIGIAILTSVNVNVEHFRRLHLYNNFNHDGDNSSDQPPIIQLESSSGMIQLQQHTTDTPPLQQSLLTIAVDHYVSCPDKCIFVHQNLPPWVRYRYVDFENENGLSLLDTDPSSHLLLLVRTNIIKLAEYAEQRKARLQTNTSVGMWHMADERFCQGEIENTYHKFDYVLRHYYRSDFFGMKLRAMGNITCSSSTPNSIDDNSTTLYNPPLPTTNPKEPKWGVHWLHLDAHTPTVHMSRSATSIWPTYKRPTNCSFIGRKDVKRSVGERQQMQDAIAARQSDLNCTIEMTNSFASGEEPFQYYNQRLASTKIGLSPRGSAIETHRLAEILRMGSVPALKDEEYVHATFRSVPGIIGANWTSIADQMVEYLANEKAAASSPSSSSSALQTLAQEAAQFSQDLHDCVVADMDYILRRAFGIISSD